MNHLQYSLTQIKTHSIAACEAWMEALERVDLELYTHYHAVWKGWVDMYFLKTQTEFKEIPSKINTLTPTPTPTPTPNAFSYKNIDKYLKTNE